MYNKAILIGRLTAEPELKYTQSGTAVVSFRLAVDRPYKGQDGQRQADIPEADDGHRVRALMERRNGRQRNRHRQSLIRKRKAQYSEKNSFKLFSGVPEQKQ